jgi:hypothetical protein
MPALPALAFLLVLVAQQPVAPAAASAPLPPAARYLQVSAPFAQQLILATKAVHPELKKIGLHAVPPGQTDSCIIANAIPSKIGKISSAKDLEAVISGQARNYPHAEEGGFFDLALSVSDQQHQPVGLLVMEIPYRFAPESEQALAMGRRIRNEIAAKIPSKPALFGPAA